MASGPTLLQRQAIGKLFQHITNEHSATWGNYLFESLEDWNLLPNSDISRSQYYSTLANLPSHPKRVICQIVIMGWNEHHNIQTLYDSIISLIYLKVCGPAEYLFLQQIYNFIIHFKSVCDDVKNIYINQLGLHQYNIVFEKNYETLAVIDIKMNHPSTDPGLDIIPWFVSFDNLKGLERHTTRTQIQSINDFVSNEVMPIIDNEFAKTHCPWIYSSYEYKVKCDPDDYFTCGMAPIITIFNIEYVDNNGI